MLTLSAFADEISPDPQVQLDVLKQSNVRHIEFRSILSTNVLALSDLQIDEFHALLQREGFKLSAIGSPIGKIAIDQPFEPHLEKFQRAIHLAKKFGTPNIRIFSYYPPAGSPEHGFDWSPWRNEVIRRMKVKVEIAEKEGIMLFHENEHRIYGDSPERLADLYAAVQSPNLRAAFDPANFVFCDYDPWAGWEASKAFTAHLHIKDWKYGEKHGALAGQGDGLMERIIGDAVKRGYSGFATLEPHLLGGGPTGGVTGPELFPQAIEAFRQVMRNVGATEQVIRS
ncbi:sugar phosphate isomerase/epimerase family protein [Tuwongella immobilis]|uniref:Xylose isomerase-like TIM barrel domain-containing protein n=1 Tax=Tuwongella immobilis TaxID=692036 RepID=A0A6C2YMU0_9BACT|nr:sugar phosphate isomerase/epimerase family protein [Tuwongella immobilis]VIP02385.1 Xylose isomerase domain-containing protein TIM barrel OS=Isosphaera pallida (strain ATCC 43644 / DSM 9630 / IS1B) GN=Isop_2191 PE=4 SV=1: AP_endonuc_2 [Tuwongella immobilis]VTS01241.1 Xylose isomerase domain-containing protein TIM barrel OS=Isosphaera pallida (strain ATCC 43644 / DSM 9630 / IS1B) GN=Isop_2191 PE=4 SV=1: AP_endonuc_2 [Tuwongella immobilis]